MHHAFFSDPRTNLNAPLVHSLTFWLIPLMKVIPSARLFTLLALLLFWSACTTVQETGRRQLVLISPEQEAQLGLTSFQQMKQELPASKNSAAAQMVRTVGQRIASVAQLPNAQWEFVLFDSPEANAFCLPGGKVGVYEGILKITQNEAGLATVMGHEVAHAVARHGAERISEAMLIQAGGTVLSATLDDADPQWQAAAATAYGLGSALGRQLPHSRAQESEADHIGLLYMARAGYDPEEAVKFWQRFAEFNEASGAGNTPWFLRTHPLDQQRIEQLKAWLPEAKAEQR
jgi:predicted Zn-dependent protease